MIKLFVFGLFLISAFPADLCAQGREFDEDAFSLHKTGAEEIREASESAGDKAIREIKYVIGGDNRWFTVDDEVYHFFTAEYDKDGRIEKKICFKPGIDGKSGTTDDLIQNYQLYEFKQGKPSGEASFNGAGNDGIWLTKDDTLIYRSSIKFDKKGHKAGELRTNASGAIIRHLSFECDGNGRVLKDVEYTAPGSDGKWLTPDDEVEKYHRREYDDGLLMRVTECLWNQDGKGPDGTWFTPDDVVSSTKEFIRDDQGRVVKVLKCVKPGPDGKWFTGDEVMQYYTVREY